MSKEVPPIEKNEAVLEPPDADHLYSAKVNYVFLESFISSCILILAGLAESCSLSQSNLVQTSLKILMAPFRHAIFGEYYTANAEILFKFNSLRNYIYILKYNCLHHS